MTSRLAVLARYIAAGSVAVAVHYMVLIALVEASELNPTLASSTGFTVGVIVNYLLQYYWTFRSTESHATRFPLFAGVAIAMLGVNASIFWSLATLAGIHYLIAQAVAIAVVFIANFIINSRITFASGATAPKQS